MARFENINGVDFEVIRSDSTHWFVQDARKHAGDTLANHYGRWSSAKDSIYNYWRNFFAGCECAEMFGVRSANTFSFTVSALYVRKYQSYTTVLGAFIITPTHNYLYLYK